MRILCPHVYVCPAPLSQHERVHIAIKDGNKDMSSVVKGLVRPPSAEAFSLKSFSRRTLKVPKPFHQHHHHHRRPAKADYLTYFFYSDITTPSGKARISPMFLGMQSTRITLPCATRDRI